MSSGTSGIYHGDREVTMEQAEERIAIPLMATLAELEVEGHGALVLCTRGGSNTRESERQKMAEGQTTDLLNLAMTASS